MAFGKERMSSYVDRGNQLIKAGKTQESMQLITQGLNYYTQKIIKAIMPYSKADAGLIVLVLRHLADEVEMNNPGAKELAEGMEKCISKPALSEVEKIKKPNRR